MEIRKRLLPLAKDVDELELNLSVDCVIFTIQNSSLKVLLTKLVPEMKWMLPGGFMTKNENSDKAASRILKFRTGVENIYLNQFQIFSDPGRFNFSLVAPYAILSEEDPEVLDQLPERVISIGYFALVNFESVQPTGGVLEEESCWCSVNELPDLGYDHAYIVKEAMKALRKEVYFRPIVYKLLPEKFTLPELQSLYEVILGKSLDRGSFQRKMLRWNIFERLEERREGVAHKRPFLYRFDNKKYESAIEQGMSFGM